MTELKQSESKSLWKSRKPLRHARSQLELQKSSEDCIDWLHNLEIAWKLEKNDSTFLKSDDEYYNNPNNHSRSPIRRHHQRKLNIDKIIENLNVGLPLRRTTEIQTQLEQLASLIFPTCNLQQKARLKFIVYDQYVFSADILETKFKQPISIDELLKIPQTDWLSHHIDILLLNHKKKLKKTAEELSYPLIKAWTPFETSETLLREDKPLRWLLRLWINKCWEPVEIESAIDGLQRIAMLPRRLRLILIYQTKQFIDNGLESEDMRGVCLVTFIYFSIFIPMIQSSEHRRTLYAEFKNLDISCPDYITARKQIGGK